MTVTIDQAMRGAMRYADNEVIPHLPGGKGIGAGIMLALIMEGSREKILALRENPAVKMMQIFDDAGKPVKAYGMGQNITHQKLAQAEYDRLRAQLTSNLDGVAGSFQLNLSKNLYISGYSPYEEVLRACETKTADEHFEAVAAVIQNEEGKKQIREIFNCRHLSEIFESGQKYAEMIYQIRRGEGTAIYWIHTTVYMMRNPENGDLEGITYSKNITAQK